MKDMATLASAQTAALRECQRKYNKVSEALKWLVRLHHDVGPQDDEWKDALENADVVVKECAQ